MKNLLTIGFVLGAVKQLLVRVGLLNADGTPAAGGGGSVAAGYVSVGETGTYSTVKAAFDAGESQLEFVSDVLEDTSITGTGGFPAEDVTVNVGPYTWTLDDDVELEDTDYDDLFDIMVRNGGFVWAQTVANNQALRCKGGQSIELNNGKFVFKGNGLLTNNSTQDQCGLNSSDTAVCGEGNFRVTLPNKYECFLHSSSASGDMVWGTVELLGGGSSCYEAIKITGNAGFICDKIILNGTWSSSQRAIELPSIYSDVGTISMLVSADMELGGCVKSIHRAQSVSQFSTLTLADDGQILGGDLMAFDDVVVDHDTLINHCRLEFEDISGVGTVRRVDISHCFGWNSQNDDWTITTAYGQYIANRNLVSITCSGDENVIIGNVVGKNTGGGGGAGTITVSGDKNVCIGNLTDAAISNTGSDNQDANNVEF